MPALQALCRETEVTKIDSFHSENRVERASIDFLNYLSVVDKARKAIGSIRFRYLTFNDVNKKFRREWLDELVSNYDCHVHSDSGTFHLSLAGSDFDVFMVGGIDIVRMAKVFRSGEAILRGRVKIALVSDSSPRQRARLLTAGFDDVFDIEKLHQDEAAVRLQAISARYEMRRMEEDAVRYEDAQLERVCHPAEINKRERIILLALMKSENLFASYYALQSAISDYHEIVSFGSLKVSVTHLRKKMKPGTHIASRSGEGYQLIIRG